MALEWTIVDEIRLYRWVAEFKPAGAHRHFHMVCILERMNHPEKYPVILLQKETVRPGKLFTAQEIWDKLGLAYNLEEIDKLEDQEFKQVLGNELRERRQQLREVRDFELPWDEYGELILENARNGVDEETSVLDSTVKQEDGEALDELRSQETNVSGQEETDMTGSKRRSTRIRQSKRLKRSRPSSDEEGSSKESSDSEMPGSTSVKPKDSSEELQPTSLDADEAEESGSSGDLPLAKRTRHSSQTRATDETSPKRKKRSSDSTTAAPTVPTRVSSRLRNRKQ